jgi:amino acid permease
MESVTSGLRNPSTISIGTNSTGAPQFYSDFEYGRQAGRMEPGPVIAQGSLIDPVRRRREFKGRHIQMMGLGKLPEVLANSEGAAIGTGLFYQSGKVLYFAGPIPACIAYLLMGTVLYSVLVWLIPVLRLI